MIRTNNIYASLEINYAISTSVIGITCTCRNDVALCPVGGASVRIWPTTVEIANLATSLISECKCTAA